MIEIINLTKNFEGNKGIKNATFAIDQGDLIGIVGKNGAGKSTLIKTIFGEYSKDKGEILVDKVPINKEHLRKIEFFPDQSIYPKNISLYDYSYYSASLSGLEKKYIDNKLNQLFKDLNLESYKNKRFNELSAGMQKRALLIVCLISDPQIIFMDEPTANVDIDTRQEFQELILYLNKKGKSIIITSHLIDELEHIINRLIIIDEGKIKYNNWFDNKKEKIVDIYNKYVSKAKNINIKY